MQDDTINWDDNSEDSIPEPSNKNTEALTNLLKQSGLNLSAVKANKLLLSLGILDEKERPSGKDPSVMKKFKVLTNKGLYFGINKENMSNPAETSPYYYTERFEELTKLLNENQS